jgi:amino acid transporter
VSFLLERRAPEGVSAGWGFLVALLQAGWTFTGYVGAATAAPSPFIFILEQTLGRPGSALVWLAVAAMWFRGLSSITSNSRMPYAFARGRARQAAGAAAPSRPSRSANTASVTAYAPMTSMV